MQKITIDSTMFPNISKVKFDMSQEPIYAIMITGKDDFHSKLATNAVINFLQQTYLNRYLLIVNDGNYCFEVPDIPQQRIIQLTTKKMPLGALRNQALEYLPQQALWVIWDDDDWRCEFLIEEQYRILKQKNVEACSLGSQIKYDFLKNRAWEDFLPKKYHGYAGTLMARNKKDICYPHQRKGEDSVFWGQYIKRYSFYRWNNPAHYYLRFIHGYNTWHSFHFGMFLRKRNKWNVDIKGKEYLDKILPMYNKFFDNSCTQK